MEPTGRAFWESKRGTKKTLVATDSLLKLVNEVEPKATLKYDKHYIGLEVDGAPMNFVKFMPRKAHAIMTITLPQAKEMTNQLEEAGIETLTYDAQFREYRIRIFLVEERAISEELRSRMLSWRYSGFSVHNQVRVTAEDAEGRKELAGYMLRAPLSLAKMRYDAASGTVIHRSRMHLGLKSNFQVMADAEWLELLCKHIPERYEQLVRYCGWYSSRSRGARAARLAASATISSGVTKGLSEFAQRAKAAWARLIRKVYEADPLECPKCKGPMRVIALIEDPVVVRAILVHLGRWQPKAVECAPSVPPRPGPLMRACRSRITPSRHRLKPRSGPPALAPERGFACLNGADAGSIRHNADCAYPDRPENSPWQARTAANAPGASVTRAERGPRAPSGADELSYRLSVTAQDTPKRDTSRSRRDS